MSGLHAWLSSHPISQNCIITFIFGIIFLLLSRYWDTLIQLVKLQPKRLRGAWLRARIQALRSTAYRIEKCSKDLNFYIAQLVRSFGFGLLFMALAVSFPALIAAQATSDLFQVFKGDEVPKHAGLAMHIIGIGTFFLPLFLSGREFYSAIRLSDQVKSCPQSLAKIRLKSIKVGGKLAKLRD